MRLEQFLTSSVFGFNWLDLFIALIVAFYAIEGYSVGVVLALLDFLSFILSFLFGLKFYAVASTLLLRFFTMPKGFSQAIGFFIVAFVSEMVLGMILKRILRAFHKKSARVFPPLVERLDHILGIVPGVLSAVVLLAFLLTLVVSLPLAPFLKRAVFSSKLGNLMVANAQGLEKNLNTVFGGAINDTLNFLTVEPKSSEMLYLNFKTGDSTVDAAAEQAMAQMVNRERTTRGLPPLREDFGLRDLARAHSRDMFTRGYFSHYTPEGLSPFDRMAAADISYNYAGENLALAPDVSLAMQGLMQSPGHRKNILSPNFKKIGIGVLESSSYGEMFTQEFTD